MKALKFLVVIAIYFYTSFAQEPLFTVLISQGDNSIIESNNVFLPLNVSDKIFKDQNIRLGGNAYLVLLHNSGKTLELVDKGITSVNRLDNEIKTKTNSALASVAEYIKNEILPPTTIEDTIPGAVERSLAEIKAYYPSKSCCLIDSMTIFRWQKLDSIDDYHFKIYDSFDNILYESVVSGKSINVNLDLLNLKKDEIYFWSVSLPENNSVSSDEIYFFRLSESKIASIQDTIKILENNLENQFRSALGRITLASLYSRNNVVDRAIIYYNEAINLKPFVADFKKRYNQFLIRNGLFEENDQLIKEIIN